MTRAVQAPRRIVHLLDMSGHGGDARTTIVVAGGQRDRGHRVSLVSPVVEHHDVLTRLAGEAGLALTTIDQLARDDSVLGRERVRRTVDVLRAHRPDVIHLQVGGIRARDTSIAAARLSGAQRRIVTVHGGLPWSVYEHAKRYQRRWALASRLAHRIVVPSTDAATLQYQAGIPTQRVSVVPNPVPEPALDPDSASRISSELSTKPGRGPIILFAARLEDDKGAIDAVEAAELLRARGVQSRFVFVGDGPLRDEIGRRAATHGAITLLGHRSDLPELLVKADLLVHPSRAESFGLTVVESMRLGTPVVATRVGVVCDLPEAAVSTVPVADPVALADAIERMVRDDPRAQIDAAHAAAGRFDLDTVLDSLDGIYGWT